MGELAAGAVARLQADPSGAMWSSLYSLGAVMAVVYYGLVIRENYRTKTCGMPIIGIAAILVQCLVSGTFGPWWRPDLFPHNPYIDSGYPIVWVWRVWLVLQAVVLYQFFKYHDSTKHGWELPLPGVNARAVAVLLIILNLVGQWTFIVYFHDVNVNASDPVAYLFLAIGWVVLALNRPGHLGLSYPVAWLKVISTAIIYMTPFVHPLTGFGTILAQPNSTYQVLISQWGCVGPNPTDGNGCPMMDVVCSGDDYTPALYPNPDFNPKPRPIVYEGCPKPRGQRLDAGDFAGRLLLKREELEASGWRITGFTSVYHSNFGEYELVRTRTPVNVSPPVDAMTLPRESTTLVVDKWEWQELQSTWGQLWSCLANPPKRLDAPHWEVQPVPFGLFSCVDGTVRMKYQFPVTISALCVGFDALYVYLLWQGRRQRKAAAMAAAI